MNFAFGVHGRNEGGMYFYGDVSSLACTITITIADIMCVAEVLAVLCSE